MEHLFCTYKQSLELKHLGFNEPCFTWFWDDIGLYNGLGYGKHNQSEYYISAPLKSQSINWIREKYGYFCSPTESTCIDMLIELIKNERI